MRRYRAAPHSDLAANDRLARKKEAEKRTRPARARRGGRRARKSLLLLRLACADDAEEAGAAGRTIGRRANRPNVQLCAKQRVDRFGGDRQYPCSGAGMNLMHLMVGPQK